jgi:predicted nucleotidyltransferase
MATRLDTLLADRAAARERTARQPAAGALAQLTGAGVEAGLVGSLARGRFLGHSDVDFLVLDAAGLDDGAIIGLIEPEMRGLPFDVIVLDRVREPERSRLLEELVRASDVRPAAATA